MRVERRRGDGAPPLGYRSAFAGVAKLVDARDLNLLSAPGETRDAELPKLGETGHRQSRAKRIGRKAEAKV